MNFCNIKPLDIANGCGIRVSLFVSGCTHHCKGCFQPETWDFSYGEEFTKEIENKILEHLNKPQIKGLTVLGGEPFEPENQKCLTPFLKRVKSEFPKKDIWCYTGYLFDKELLKPSRARCDFTDDMLSYIDVLVDGRFVESKKNLMLKFRGSENQRIIDVKKSIESGKILEYDI